MVYNVRVKRNKKALVSSKANRKGYKMYKTYLEELTAKENLLNEAMKEIQEEKRLIKALKETVRETQKPKEEIKKEEVKPVIEIKKIEAPKPEAKKEEIKKIEAIKNV
jgi:hypothetical protein